MRSILGLESVPEILRMPVQHWWERACSAQEFLDLYAAQSEEGRAQLPRVVAGSEFVASVLIRDPQALDWRGRYDDPAAARSANADYEARAASASTYDEAQRILREWRRREMLRIAWRDIAARSGVVDTLHAVSDLADACIRAATAAAQLHLQPVFGMPRDAQLKIVPLIVLGMGKLGGHELNFSSDIDLVFLFAEPGETDGPRVIDNQEYFTRLGSGAHSAAG